MSPEITAQLFVVPCHIPLSVRLAAKVLSGRKDLQKTADSERSSELLFPIGTGRSTWNGLLEQMP